MILKRVITASILMCAACFSPQVETRIADGATYRIVHKPSDDSVHDPVDVFRNGTLLSQGNLVRGSGNPTGSWKRFHPDGSLACSGSYGPTFDPADPDYYAEALVCLDSAGRSMPKTSFHLGFRPTPCCEPFPKQAFFDRGEIESK